MRVWSQIMRSRYALLALGVTGCHSVLPYSSPSHDGALPDHPVDVRRDQLAQPVDGHPLDGRLPDARVADGPRPCVEEHFTAATGWVATPGLGTWTWVSPSSTSQTDPDVLNGYAVVNDPQGYAKGSAVTTVDLVVTKLLQNKYDHGAGASLMIQPGSASYPGRQVACVVVQNPTSAAAFLDMIYYDGSMDVAGVLTSDLLPAPILGQPATLIMRTTSSAGSWQMTCELSNPPSKIVRDITSLVTLPPLSIAIATYTAAASFDRVKVCPE